MIFSRGGGIRSQNEKFVYGDQVLQIVSKYTYLGVILTPKLSFSEHLKARSQSSKVSVNSTWKYFIGKEEVKHSDKIALFNAVSRSILCYAAQIWGFHQYDEIERVQRFFLKKMFCLPRHVPNYALILETGAPNLYIYTLRLHFMYMFKVLFKYDSTRLPRKLAWMTLVRGIYWSEAWYGLLEKHSMALDFEVDSQLEFRARLLEIVEAEEVWHRRKACDRATCTVRHGLYDKLDYLNKSNYFTNELPLKKISLILRYRCGLVNLNASPWRKEGSSSCSLCNLSVDEDLVHFLGVCPILAEFRRFAFMKNTLDEEEIIDILNGKNNYSDLVLYITKAWEYRKFLVSEYNC